MQCPSLTADKERILVVDSDASVLLYTKRLLEKSEYNVETASVAGDLLQRLKSGHKPDLILLDLDDSASDGFCILEACRKLRPQQKIVVYSRQSSPSRVAEAMRLGALDYLCKPFSEADLDKVTSRWLSITSHCVHGSASDCESIDPGVFFVAASPAMKKIRAQVEQLARVDIPVLLLGESGVGKEVMARMLHKLSPRAHNPLLKVNCAAIPNDLLESELFGHEAGAFTGATKSKPGQFEMCDQGTMLLDEIGEMSPALQAKLLHVLQDGQFSRLGGRAPIAAEFRVLAATNIDIEDAIAAGRFREDLYYRLNAFTVRIPPLRERQEEIRLLFEHFVTEFAGKFHQRAPHYSDRLIDECVRYSWPGNLRELGNFVKRFVVFQDEAAAMDELNEKARDLPPNTSPKDLKISQGHGLKTLMKDLKHLAEMQVIQTALTATNWNRKRAASELKISSKALRYKIKQYQLSPAKRAPGTL